LLTDPDGKGSIGYRRIAVRFPMKRLFQSAIVSTFIGVSIVAFSQGPGKETTPNQQREQNQHQKVSLTGCLVKGAEANEYVITDQTSREKVTFNGPAEFYRFVNLTVRVTGHIVTRDNEDRVFQPETLAPLSSSCESAQRS
jgi:hypothetical protein